MIDAGRRWRWHDEIAQHLRGTIAAVQTDHVALGTPTDPLHRFLGVTSCLTAVSVEGHASAGNLVQEEKQITLVAFIDIPDRVVLERYRADAKILWSRELAVCLYVRLVVLTPPSSAVRRHFLSQIPADGPFGRIIQPQGLTTTAVSRTAEAIRSWPAYRTALSC